MSVSCACDCCCSFVNNHCISCILTEDGAFDVQRFIHMSPSELHALHDLVNKFQKFTAFTLCSSLFIRINLYLISQSRIVLCTIVCIRPLNRNIVRFTDRNAGECRILFNETLAYIHVGVYGSDSIVDGIKYQIFNINQSVSPHSLT